MSKDIKVELISFTPNPDKVVSCAAKLCYSPVGVSSIQDNLTDEEISRFVNMLMNIGHESPIEHVSFTFAIEGISRACSHQLVRHRLASYSQQSQRYVKLDQFEYIIPPEIENSEECKELFIASMKQVQNTYDSLVDKLIINYATNDGLFDEFNNSIGNDISFIEYLKLNHKSQFKKYEKKSIEDARYVFPNACETKLVCTFNARSLHNFFNHRCCERAQWEINELAFKMVKLVKEVAPILFKNAGPNCLTKPCPEGKMSCGKITQVRELYKSI